jgi:hypothetical protein
MNPKKEVIKTCPVIENRSSEVPLGGNLAARSTNVPSVSRMARLAAVMIRLVSQAAV